jgi:hypothetical protein
MKLDLTDHSIDPLLSGVGVVEHLFGDDTLSISRPVWLERRRMPSDDEDR